MSSFKYVIGLGVLLLILFKIGSVIEFVFITLFKVPYGSLSVGIMEIIIQTPHKLGFNC